MSKVISMQSSHTKAYKSHHHHIIIIIINRKLHKGMSNVGNTAPIPSHCYLSISIAGDEPQTVVIELFSGKLPITCRNFANLCCAEGATSKKRPLATYRNTEFHRIVPKFMVQGGDFEKFDGTGGCSSFGGTFSDEGFVISHDRAGVVSMANRGKDTNGSQFFITLEATPHLNGKHVAFGQVVEGMNVIHAMTKVELEGTKPTPMQRILIVDSGKGRGPVEKTSDDTDLNASATKRRKKKDKKKREKHQSKRRKRDRRRYSRSDDESSLPSSSTSEEGRQRRKRKRKQKRKRRHDYSSDSDDSSERRHKQNAKRRRREER
jgi:cyclophilin family peptidyl-prolyl cis-trans isomerase